MTCESSLCSSYSTHPSMKNVKTENGSSVVVLGEVSIPLTSSMSLSIILYDLYPPSNLLSIS